MVELLHHDQLLEHGGIAGTRDENTLASALARPRNRWFYGRTRDLSELAAIYGHALTTGHPYVDGNKRTGFLAMAVFLEVNGQRLEATDQEVVTVMVELAAGASSEERLSAWVLAHSVPGPDPR